VLNHYYTLPSSKQYKIEIPWRYCYNDTKSAQKIQNDKIFNENLISKWQNEKMAKCVFVASTLQKWPNLLKLSMKVPI